MFTPLLKWCLEKGLIVTAVYEIIRYVPGTVFDWFTGEVSGARRAADNDKDNKAKELLGNTFKLKENALYGKLIEDREKHTNTIFTTNEDKIEEFLGALVLRT